MNTITMNLYYSNVREEKTNNKYPLNQIIYSIKDLKNVVQHDHTATQFKDSQRKNANFLQANCSIFDVDNDHSDNPKDWKTPKDIQKSFPDVAFYIVYSRNNMKQKGTKTPRPKFHVYFPHCDICNSDEYGKFKSDVCNYYEFFDKNAKDLARFFFGVENPQAGFFSGEKSLVDFMKDIHLSNDDVSKKTPSVDSKCKADILEGERNSTMFSFARIILKNQGDTHNAYQNFLNESERCKPKLDMNELNQIWNSAKRYIPNLPTQPQEQTGPVPYTIDELPVMDYKITLSLEQLPVGERKMTIAILENWLKAYGISVRFNIMNRSLEISGLPECFCGEDSETLLTTLIFDWGNKRGFKRNTLPVIIDNLNLIAHKSSYHPVIERLKEKPWDGKDRLADIYRILGLTDSLHETLFRKWALQTIALLYNSDDNPISAQGVLVLQGEQGIGKSQFFSHLAIDRKFFKGGATLDMANKDSIMSATKVWICELGEVDSTTKKEQSALKAFLTESKDHYREPYARKEVAPLRRTSFCGTVNPQAYLHDITGNRRFWTIPVKEMNHAGIFIHDSEWYAQFWRQIQKEYLANRKSYLLTTEEQASIMKRNTEYEAPVTGEDEFLSTFDIAAEKEYWVPMTMSEVANILNEEHKGLNIHASTMGKILVPRLEKHFGRPLERAPKAHGRCYYFPPRRGCGSNNYKTPYDPVRISLPGVEQPEPLDSNPLDLSEEDVEF